MEKDISFVYGLLKMLLIIQDHRKLLKEGLKNFGTQMALG